MTAPTVAKAFLDGWISRFGVSDRIHSDQGPQFESSLFAELCTLLQVRKSRTTPCYPAVDGLVERMNWTFITTLRTYANDHLTYWDEHLQFALLAHRIAVQKSLTTHHPSSCSDMRLAYHQTLLQPTSNMPTNNHPCLCSRSGECTPLCLPSCLTTWHQCASISEKVLWPPRRFQRKVTGFGCLTQSWNQ